MDGCPPLEDIAAFLDGTLSPEERARMTEHLARCESCYEIFAGAVHFQEEFQEEKEDAALVAAAALSHRYITDRFLPDKASAEDTGGRGVLPFPLRGKEDRPPRRIARWLPLAASVVLAAGLGFFVWEWFFATPAITLAGVIEPIEGKSRISDALYESDTPRGPEDPQVLVPPGPELMAGVHLLDLRLSVEAKDVEATAARLQNLGTELKEVVGLKALSQRYYDEYGKMHTAGDLERFAARLPAWESELQGILSDSLLFQFGLWAEAGRLAAITQTREFFERRNNRRFLSHLQKTLPEQLTLPPELQQPVLNDLRAIERTWDQGELSPEDYQTLKERFQGIIKQIDNYEEDLHSDD